MPTTHPSALKCLSVTFWILAHGAAVWIVLCSSYPNILPKITIGYAFLTWAFIFTVHAIDKRTNGDGVYALGERRKATRPGDDEHTGGLKRLFNGLTEHLTTHHSQSLRTELIAITTGFTSVLAFEAIEAFEKNLDHLWPFPGWTLAIICVLLVLACIVNLIQMHVHILLSRPYWNENDRKSFKGLLKVLEELGWNLFLTPVILFLCLMPESKNNLGYWLAFSMNFIYGALLWTYYFWLKADVVVA